VLQGLLGLPAPRYRHHPLLRDPSGRRLAKRDHALTIRAMRAAGLRPDEVIGRALATVEPP
jgi:glutamyl/glutaminyl-tRNA synthetase